jgi:hypothetical protein
MNERELAEAIAALNTPKSCSSCGRTFGGPSAYAIHQDQRCLPDSALESLLVRVDGIWLTRAQAASR